MTAKKASKCAMDKILQGKVKQVPSWHFVLKNFILWLIGITCIIAGAFTVSLIIFTIANSTLFIDNIASDHVGKRIVVAMPVLWIFVTAIFILLFKVFIRHTDSGYKYSIAIIILANIFLSLIMGVALYLSGISYLIDDVLGELRHYNSVEKRHGIMFNNPDHGVIVGRVVGCAKGDYFTLMSPTGEKWQVMNDHIEQDKRAEIKDGQVFLVVGKKIDNNIFVACDVKLRGMKGGSEHVIRKRIRSMDRYNENKESMCNCEQVSPNMNLMIQEACDGIF
ncbi:MAG: hypothetical protein ACKUBY_01380 [Candidatus Moraniibacteriota bacterium]|jgi:hypothetical protein